MRIDPYDPVWPERFEAERRVLEQVLAPWLSAGVREYAEWKAAHLGEDGYTESKRPLVFRVLAEHGIDLKPDAERLA